MCRVCKMIGSDYEIKIYDFVLKYWIFYCWCIYVMDCVCLSENDILLGLGLRGCGLDVIILELL